MSELQVSTRFTALLEVATLLVGASMGRICREFFVS